MQTLWQDLQFGLRMLRKSPGFTAVTVLTLALGIGANTALFSVVNGVLLNPLPYPHPEQLVRLHESKPNFATGSISYPNFRDWRDRNRTFSSLAVTRGYAFSLTGMGDAERVRAQFVSSEFFPMLGVKPVIGRLFAKGEDEVGAAPVAMISTGFWNRKFGSAADVLGKSVTLDGQVFTVVGVVPADFDLLVGSFRVSEVYVPIGQWNNNLLQTRTAGLGIHGIGRLKPGVTIERARADMAGVTASLAAEYPNADKGISAALFPLRDEMLGKVKPYLLVLLGAVGFVLLIACVNVANLLLARATSRGREFAVRAALGAGQGRIVRQLLTESVLLALAGGGLGLLLAWWGTRGTLSVLPAALPRAGEIGIDARVLLFTLAVSLLAGVLFGLAPALKTARPDLHDTLKEGGRTGSRARSRTQGVFVVAQVGVTLVLLVGAGLMLRSLTALWSVDPGFRTENVMTFSMWLPPSMMKANPDAIRAAMREFDRKLGATPGVQAISLSWGAFPMNGDDEQLFWLEGQPKPQNTNDMNWALKYVIESDYLKVMGIPLRRGRFFTPHDDEHAPLVMVIDDVFARKYFGDDDPVGKHLNLDDFDKPAEIVGVVGHVKQWGLDSDDTEKLRAQLYLPFMQLPDAAMALAPAGTDVAVRFEGGAPALFDALRQTSKQMSNQQVIHGAQTMEEIISSSLAARRFSMMLLSVFAALALLLSSVGIYGVISYLVGQRTHEIGIRLALGAQRNDVLHMVLGEGMRLAALGVGLGLVGALALTRFLSTMLYGVKPHDPVTYAAVAILLGGIAALACWVPARRAMRVDPIVALRYE
jgi:predicted permease